MSDALNNTAPRATLEQLPDTVIDAAITWSVKLDFNRATTEIQHAFQQWLKADRQHALAWERVGSLRREFAELPAQPALQALQTLDHRRRERGINRRQALKLLSLTGVAVASGVIVRDHTPWQRLFAEASTATGEQKSLQLSDGTTIVLNSDSAISTDLIGGRRRIVLRRGEILITTGNDAGSATRRPFWVYTPFGRMQALGTRFVVRLDEQRARIAVQDGAVELHPAGGGDSYIVRAAESRWLADAGTAVVEPQGFEVDGWADGVIAGKNIRLADLLTELSRYRPGRIVCDERVADLRVSGVFHIRDTDQALQFLLQTQPVSINYRTRFWVAVGPVANS